ncbi:MAG TPA: hypothetical protein VHB79_08090 [Polyangiaceae bacterium]|nr:hypothetical protein [Polyangiaceae bacterium]
MRALHEEGQVLWAPPPNPIASVQKDYSFAGETVEHDGKPYRRILVAFTSPLSSWDQAGDGVWSGTSDLAVAADICAEIAVELDTETSDICRHSTRPIRRAFVYVDISDYSQMPAGLQLLVVLALVRLAEAVEKSTGANAEAKLCIGDGYIYAFDDAVAAVRFAGQLLRELEGGVAAGRIPEFHVRVGAHVGAVRWFWDPGRDDWNYIGDGINGGNRVLGAIGKATDDVIYVSGQVRQEIQVVAEGGLNLAKTLLGAMLNRGRHEDKHKRMWRVYELSHAVAV